MFKVKDGYKAESQTPETRELFGSTKKLIEKTKNGENFERVEVVLVRRNLPDNQYQQISEVLYTFAPQKNVKASNLVFLKIHINEFDEIIITFTDENGRPLETENKVDLTLLVNK